MSMSPILRAEKIGPKDTVSLYAITTFVTAYNESLG